MKPTDQNAKNREWQVPADMPGLEKNRYNRTMSASQGSQKNPAPAAEAMKEGKTDR